MLLFKATFALIESCFSALPATLVHEKPRTSFFSKKSGKLFFIFSKNSEALLMLSFKATFARFRRVSIGAEVTYY